MMYPIYRVKGKYNTQETNFYYNKRNLTDGLTLIIFEHGDKADFYFDWDDNFPGDAGLRDWLFPDQKIILDELERIYEKSSALKKVECFGWSAITLKDISLAKAEEIAKNIRTIFSKRFSLDVTDPLNQYIHLLSAEERKKALKILQETFKK